MLLVNSNIAQGQGHKQTSYSCAEAIKFLAIAISTLLLIAKLNCLDQACCGPEQQLQSDTDVLVRRIYVKFISMQRNLQVSQQIQVKCCIFSGRQR